MSVNRVSQSSHPSYINMDNTGRTGRPKKDSLSYREKREIARVVKEKRMEEKLKKRKCEQTMIEQGQKNVSLTYSQIQTILII